MRLLLLFFAFLYCNQIRSQELVSELPIRWRNNSMKVTSFTDKDYRQAAVVVSEKDSLMVLLTDFKGNMIKQYYSRRMANDEILGGYFRDGKLVVVERHYNEVDFQNHVFDMQSGKVTRHKIERDAKRGYIVETVNAGDHFLMVVWNRKTSEMDIYDFRHDDRFETITYRFDGEMKKAMKSTDITYVDPFLESDVQIAGPLNKLYLRKDTLFLLSNRERNVTNVFAFDLEHRNASHLTIQHTDVPGETHPEAYSENSFLLDNALYYVHSTGDVLTLQVIDFHSGNVLKKHVAQKNEDIHFRNTTIVQEGTNTRANVERDIENTKKLLRKMRAASAVIMATRNRDHQVELTIGSYEEFKNSGSIERMGEFHSSAVYRPFATPYTWTKTARFKTLLDPVTHEHLPGEIPVSLVEKIEKFQKSHRYISWIETVFFLDNVCYYALYDPKGQKIAVYKF